MAKGENFYGEMEIGADVRPKQKIDVKRIKKARNTRNNSVFDENKTFDSNAAIKEAGKRKSKKIRKKKVESEKFEALKQDKVDEPEQTMPKNVTAQELQWWKERRGVIKLKPDDTMGELPVRQDKHRSKVFQQQYFDDKYVDNLEARQEMEELAKQPSPELKQEFLEKNEEYINAKEEQEIGDKDKKRVKSDYSNQKYLFISLNKRFSRSLKFKFL